MRQNPQNADADAQQRERDLIAAAREEAARARARESAHPGAQYRWPGFAAKGAASASADRDPNHPIRDVVPGYEIERELHRGGQGVVYRALQKSTRRQVAIKVMKEGPFAGSEDKARFDREVRILGQLNHPSIVTIHDSGTAAGCFYYVMNYIAGPQLDAYLRHAGLSLNQTLGLFVRICDAVNAAHLRGIIHRDLKPSNIRIDADGQPHILDFGLAKAEEGSSAPGESLAVTMTHTGQFVGSLPWASPEQVSSVVGGIDVRSDVYSLGVVLYQMLTGVFPYEVRGNSHEVVQRILNAEPLRPSLVAGSSTSRPRIDGRTQSAALPGRINDEIDTIVLKCLSKERDRRYQNAGELARDIRHYLAGEPIEARRDSTWYVMKKVVRRHSFVFGSAAAMVLLMAGGLISSLTLWQMALQARDDAQQANAKERAHRELAEDQRREAETIKGLVISSLVSADPRVRGAQGLLVTDAMNQIVENLDHGMLADQPDREIVLRVTIADILRGNGRELDALDVAEKAHEIAQNTPEGDDEILVAALSMVVLCLVDLDRPAEALPKAEAALAIARRLFGGDHRDVSSCLNNVAMCLGELKRADEALLKYEEALAMSQRLEPGDSDSSANILSNIGTFLSDMGDQPAAIARLDEALAMRRRLSPRETLAQAGIITNIAWALQASIRLDEALARYEEALEMHQRLLGKDHPSAVGVMRLSAKCLDEMGRREEAVEKLEAVLLLDRQFYPGDHPALALTLNDLAARYHKMRRPNEALRHFTEALEINRRLYPGDHWEVAYGFNNIAGCLQSAGDYAAALSWHESAREMRRRLYGDTHGEVAWSTFSIGKCHEQMDHPQEALTEYSIALAIYRQIGTLEHPHPLYAQRGMARVLAILKRYGESETFLLDAVQQCNQSERIGRTHWPSVLEELINLNDAWHAAEPDAGYDTQAAEWRARLVEWQASTQPTAAEGTD